MTEQFERSEDIIVACHFTCAALVAAADARAPAGVLDALLDALRGMSHIEDAAID